MSGHCESCGRKRFKTATGGYEECDEECEVHTAPTKLNGTERAFPYEAFVHQKPEGPFPNNETRYIREDELDPNPMLQFGKYFAKRASLKPKGPPIMTLSTANAAGRPSACTVILNGFDENGFVFFTHCESTKGKNIAENPQAAIVFFWPEMMLQVRAEGRVVRGTPQDCAHCFGKMPRNLLTMAAAYKQSTIVCDRQTYIDRVKKVWSQNPSTVPYPEGWYVYRLLPDRMEFWNGTGTSLITDRVEYVLQTPNECFPPVPNGSEDETMVATEPQWQVYRLAAP